MKLDKRRRIENRTNYHKRMILLKGKSPRLVIRKTNRYLILQIIESQDAQDKIIFSANTKELLEKGWPEEKSGSLKSLGAAYLAGFLLGKKAGKIKERIILDTGLIPSTKGSRIYAAVKGFADAGMKINYDKEMVPSQERMENPNTESFFSKIKSKIGGKE
jgi:large subunit ribosomal protein L18